MAQVTQTVQKEANVPTAVEYKPPEIVSSQDRDYEAYETYLAGHERSEHEDDRDGYDSEGNPVNLKDKKTIAPLPPIDHAQKKYAAFKKEFYAEHPDVTALSTDEVAELRNEMGIQIEGRIVQNPVRSFREITAFSPQLLHEIVRQGYESPTPIQAQGIPVALSGRDLIGLAKTGSGKTFAFVWPMIVHILDQPQMTIGDGPIGLVLAPTRELTEQIYSETKRFAKVFNIRTVAVYGGGGKYEMQKALKEEVPEIVIATPGRLIDLLLAHSTNLHRCTLVILDEADRMFELGFEYQIKSILQNVRPGRQTLMFSATMKRRIESFAREVLSDPIRIVVGSIGEANVDVHQSIIVLSDEIMKWTWLTSNLSALLEQGKVIIFVNAKANTEELASSLRKHLIYPQIGVECLHGDKEQSERSSVIRKFKVGDIKILVATDVAARGTTLKNILLIVYRKYLNIILQTFPIIF